MPSYRHSIRTVVVVVVAACVVNKRGVYQCKPVICPPVQPYSLSTLLSLTYSPTQLNRVLKINQIQLLFSVRHCKNKHNASNIVVVVVVQLLLLLLWRANQIAEMPTWEKRRDLLAATRYYIRSSLGDLFYLRLSGKFRSLKAAKSVIKSSIWLRRLANALQLHMC